MTIATFAITFVLGFLAVMGVSMAAAVVLSFFLGGCADLDFGGEEADLDVLPKG